MTKEFLSFALVGGFAALVNFISRIMLNKLTSYSVAIIIAYLIGMITAFVLSKVFVFKPQRKETSRQIFYFTVVNIFAVIQTLLVSLFLVNMLLPAINYNYRNEEVAHFIGICIPIFSSYLGHKHMTFANK